MMLVNLLFVVFLYYCIPSLNEDTMLSFLEWCQQHFSWVTPEGLVSFAIGVLSLLIALNWWLSYKLFTRSQVIQPKFRLL